MSVECEALCWRLLKKIAEQASVNADPQISSGAEAIKALIKGTEEHVDKLFKAAAASAAAKN